MQGLARELLIDVLLCKRTLEFPKEPRSFQEDARRNMCKRAEQPDIDAEKLERSLISICVKRDVHRRRTIHSSDRPVIHEPLYGFLEIARPRTRPDCTVDEFLVFLR